MAFFIPVSGVRITVAGQALEGRAQARVVDMFGGGLDVLRGFSRKRRTAQLALHGGVGRLHLEDNALQAGKGRVILQLAQQAALLVAQAGCPVSVGDDQQQGAIAPGGELAVLARGWLRNIGILAGALVAGLLAR